MPALVQSGVFDIARRVYGSIGPSFYGLRTTLATLLLMALLRIKRPEGLKEVSPADLGRVLGLDRAPEVKTLRRKLTRLAEMGRAASFGRELALRRVSDRGAAMGFLYVDGHVRVYHGQRTLPKAHVTRMRISLPATTDYWVNDAAGDPLFVLTAPANAGLVQMMPSILAEVRALVPGRRVSGNGGPAERSGAGWRAGCCAIRHCRDLSSSSGVRLARDRKSNPACQAVVRLHALVGRRLVAWVEHRCPRPVLSSMWVEPKVHGRGSSRPDGCGIRNSPRRECPGWARRINATRTQPVRRCRRTSGSSRSRRPDNGHSRCRSHIW